MSRNYQANKEEEREREGKEMYYWWEKKHI